MSGNLNPLAVERDLSVLRDRYEDTVRELAGASQHAAEAEARYRRAHAIALLDATGTVAEREAKAYIASADEHADRLGKEAIRDVLQEKCRMLRAEMSAVQTVAANLRELVSR